MSQLAGGWTLEKLQAKSAEERFNVWVNARAKGTSEATELARFIEQSGLDYAPSGGISMSDPRVIEMDDIISSAEGQAACLQATADGLPALAGVEPMIVEQMGSRYGSFSMMTVTAGSLVGSLMLSKGYKIASQKKMPEGSVAKTAAFWELR
ncbi:hypothetical protein [Brevundimonas vesicularis]|uniref:Uncharacterized protein n=1 Tax=Brevundimonas vesicularis TaxID=41276 RepID=A0ABU4KTL2_BREVE|nr:hypothetical protein [Brevundimonas vesicularis]MDX2336260.1 hypothetical protein [Brevundimonas vesicularis]